MSTVVIDPELAAQLTSNSDEVSLADRDGKLLGYFLSPEEYARMKKRADGRMYEEPTLEEFRRSIAKGGRHTMEDVLKLVEE